MMKDPRPWQIVLLSSLLAWSVMVLGSPVTVTDIVVLLSSTLLTEKLLSPLRRSSCGARRGFDPRSPLISGLSLALLARSDGLGWLVAVAVVTIASKHILRRRGKHIWNPTNFGIAAMVVAFPGQVWVSPGQWGSAAWVAFLLAGLGMLVVYRARRTDVTWAFLIAYSALLLGRAWWLGDPLAIVWHQLGSGALLIFAFFMISDPKTTPDSRAGRVVFAVLVSLGAFFVQFGLYRPNGLLFSLVAGAAVVPLLDRWLPGERYEWARRVLASPTTKPQTEGAGARCVTRRGVPMFVRMSHLLPVSLSASARSRGLTAALLVAVTVALSLVWSARADAFCGFYVAKADTSLFNEASQVVLVRDGDRTVLTMANDYQGDPREFAMVIPVPTLLEREQIHVAERSLLDHLDAYTSPRLVEYHDENPCWVRRQRFVAEAMPMAADASVSREEAERLGVTIEATYTVGEYDILILSAEQSDGLETWLRDNGYRIPAGASRVLGSYLRQGMRFFVAKVNLDEQARLGYSNLRPIQVAYESPKFMLPIRLGMVNAKGAQELFVYALTRQGRVETTNYRTVRLPSGMDLPVYVKDEFGDFYREMFRRQVEKERGRAVFLEYAWDMAWCDPCAAEPLSRRQLRDLGVFWLDAEAPNKSRRVQPTGAQDVFVTRLHVRYDQEHFPEDLVFQQTGDRQNFQGRYVLRHPYEGQLTCAAAAGYKEQLRARQEREIQTLADLTGWSVAAIRDRAAIAAPDGSPAADAGEPWWRRLWPGR